MYICLCKGITDKQIKACLKEGEATNLQQIRQCLGVASECGRCATDTRAIINEYMAQQNSQPTHYGNEQTAPLFYSADLAMSS